MLDEALTWAAKSGRIEAFRPLMDLGADVNADPYRGTPLTWAAVNGHTDAVRALVDLGADVDRLATWGGPDHGGDVPAINVAAQAGQTDAVRALLDLGADPTIRDTIHGGAADGWADFGGHRELAAFLRERA